METGFGREIVFYQRSKVPDLVHAFKPDPVTNRQDPNRIFDFISHTPEAMHMITWLFSPWEFLLPMMKAQVNTIKWLILRSRASCQVLLDSQAGKILTQATAEEIQAKNFNHTQDLRSG